MNRRLCHSSAVAIICMVAISCEGPTAPKTGSLTLTITGLPTEIPAAVTIVTPKHAILTATSTETLPDLDPGTYQITAGNASNDRSTFAPSSVTSAVEVTAGTTPVQAAVTYKVITGVVSISITGVPAGTTPSVTLSGAGFSKTLSASGEVGNLAPGSYGLTIGNVDSGELYAGVADPSSLTVAASITAVPVNVTYAVSTGTIALTSSGLPAGAPATWDLVGPAGFSRTVSGTGQVPISHLAPGQYAVTGRNVAVGPDTYASTTGAIGVAVAPGQVASVATSYLLKPSTLNLVIADAYLVQSTQNLSGTVPLVAGRDGYVRVFVKGNETNSATPQVRVRFYRSNQLIATQLISAPGIGAPLGISEANSTDSWGAVVSGSLLQPGTSFVADVDPGNTVRETDESDNQFPSTGVPKALDIRNAPGAAIRFVPIVTADGAVGNVTSARLAEMVSLTLRIHPMSAVTTDLRGAYTTSLALQRKDSNAAFERILGEIDVLRVAEGSGRQYVGVLKDNAGTGIAGYGYLPGNSVVIIDADYASETLAHELGHNWSLPHAPCGGAANTDPNFPYPGGKIGVYGYDGATGRIQTTDMPDLMGYCWLNQTFNISLPRQWISDYNYMKVMNYRQLSGDVTPLSDQRQQCLIVWGRVTARGILLEPAFVTNTVPSMPARSGRLTLAALDQAGTPLMSMSFDPQDVADAPGAESHFAYAIPVDRLQLSRFAALSVSGAGYASGVMTSSAADLSSVQVTATNPVDGFVRLRWDPSVARMLVVTDPHTNEIVAFARSGDAMIRTTLNSLGVKASNGVRSFDLQIQATR